VRRFVRLRIALAAALLAGCVGSLVAQSFSAQTTSADTSQAAAQGRALYLDSCSSCHGIDARGVPGSGPSLYGVGVGAADFYLSTGRMPLDDPRDEPRRRRPVFGPSQIAGLVAYVGSLGGPPAPNADPAKGSLSTGLQVFTEKCAGCHQQLGRGGTVTGAQVPSVQQATPRQIAEAVRIGPYVMPNFSASDIDQQQLDSLARYIVYTRKPDDRGGWAIGHLGPIPEGMVAWLLGGAALVLITRLIGERIEE
jgi:ubiquinol-cytochrome c reductase cytochrome c subunit